MFRSVAGGFAAVVGAPQDGVAVGNDLRGDAGPHPAGVEHADRDRSVHPLAPGRAGGGTEAWVNPRIWSCRSSASVEVWYRGRCRARATWVEAACDAFNTTLGGDGKNVLDSVGGTVEISASESSGGQVQPGKTQLAYLRCSGGSVS
ncbi:MAG TPA: hypothetical protein VGO16_07135 [Pseudonocardiaceae bacterium]|nr:hypothetical protein [Pseudonocardiaceae bacterium]